MNRIEPPSGDPFGGFDSIGSETQSSSFAFSASSQIHAGVTDSGRKCGKGNHFHVNARQTEEPDRDRLGRRTYSPNGDLAHTCVTEPYHTLRAVRASAPAARLSYGRGEPGTLCIVSVVRVGFTPEVYEKACPCRLRESVSIHSYLGTDLGEGAFSQPRSSDLPPD